MDHIIDHRAATASKFLSGKARARGGDDRYSFKRGDRRVYEVFTLRAPPPIRGSKPREKLLR
jgi:hypothetical protein